MNEPKEKKWRILPTGETLQPGDQIKIDGDWSAITPGSLIAMVGKVIPSLTLGEGPEAVTVTGIQFRRIDHNAGYRWATLTHAGEFALQQSEEGAFRVVRLITPDNADAMRAQEIIAEGKSLDCLRAVVGWFNTPKELME